MVLANYSYKIYYIYSLYREKIKHKQKHNIDTMDLIYTLIYQKNLGLGKEMELQFQDSFAEHEKNFMANTFFSSVLKLRTEESEGIKWVNNWNIISFIGNLLQIAGTLIYLLSVKEDSRIPSSLMGLGCFCAWINSARYLMMNMEYYLLFVTFFQSLPEIFKFIISILPIFIGSIMLLCCVLWVSEYFVSPGRGLFVGLALYLGDIVTDSGERLPVISYFWANLYIYCFLIFFMFLVHSILQAIISLTYVRDVRYKYAKKKIKSVNKLKEEILKYTAICEVDVVKDIDSLKGILNTMLKNKSNEEKKEMKQDFNDFMNEIKKKVEELSIEDNSGITM